MVRRKRIGRVIGVVVVVVVGDRVVRQMVESGRRRRLYEVIVRVVHVLQRLQLMRNRWQCFSERWLHWKCWRICTVVLEVTQLG